MAGSRTTSNPDANMFTPSLLLWFFDLLLLSVRRIYRSDPLRVGLMHFGELYESFHHGHCRYRSNH
jgi:hypothetical protein